MVAHRKQGPVLPTLILTIAPDPATEKIRKRRSSRAATLVGGHNGGPTVLWFRTDSEPQKLHEWARCIQATVQASFQDKDIPAPQVTSPMTPLTPLTPGSPSFQNPFVPRLPRDASDYSYSRPPSAPKSSLHHKASSSLYMTRPLTISDTNSLRSRTSDLSSLTSSATVGTTTTTSYASAQHSELASPIMPGGDHFGGFIEGWTSAQGRSTMMSPPSRPMRDSMGSNPPMSPAAILESGSPPNPRETILDRAFQMNYIPGSENTIPGEEKLSSLARFEALMQQVEAQRRKQSLRPLSVAQQLELKSAWDLDEDEDDGDSDAEESDDTEGDAAFEWETDQRSKRLTRPELQRSPGYIRRPQTPQSPRSNAGPRSPIFFNPETLAALDGGAEKPRLPQKMHSHTLSGLGNLTLGVQQPLASTLELSPGKSSIVSGKTTVSEELMGGLNPSSAYRTSTIAEGQQHRHSTASSNGGKRLSFSEFTRRLSTSSMLLMQSNTDGDSQQTPSRRSSVFQPRAGASGSMFSSPRNEATERVEKCKSWRNSVGMFGNEGGFL